jgi:lysophospholipid acyltransferase (LPLAT)-like uncharacterized protein
MFKKSCKYHFKHNRVIQWLLVWSIFLYLKLVYITSKWQFIWPDKIQQHDINRLNGALFALWHNRLAFGMYVFRKYNNVFALASSHTDGKLITSIIKSMNYGVIEGSTNRNPTGAVRAIIKLITTGNLVVVTPDGPRGPVYKVNSSITKIAKKYDKELIPVSCMATNYFELKSWDRMMIPKPFGKIVVTIGNPVMLSGNSENDNILLENSLSDLSSQALEALSTNEIA